MTEINVLRAAASDPDLLATRPFEWLAEITRLVSNDTTTSTARELLIRACEHVEAFGTKRVILEALLRQTGLFPYLNPTLLGPADALALEAHRPPGFDEVIFHGAQAAAYRRLCDGDNVVLMAPTSFGKSIIIDALIARKHYRRVMVIVPSIALIDEMRARMQQRFGNRYHVVTHTSQSIDGDTLIVMTQERALELTRNETPPLDLLVVDEFYKLDPRMDPERADLLNTAFDRLRRQAKQIFLLGPNVGGLPEALPSDFKPRVISTDFRTVAVDIQRIDLPAAERPAELVRICRDNNGPTLVYCRAPAGCRRVAELLHSERIGGTEIGLPDAAEWLTKNVHPDWRLAQWLSDGIGVHHAQMPRWLGQYVVRAFNEGRLRVLVCTSTLIEGVNTSAKNVVIYENRVGKNALDLFTFNNISGRAGRMWRHFVGRVFHFHPHPRGPLPQVDVPILTQPDDAPTSLLLELPDAERSETSRQRVSEVLKQGLLSEATLRASTGIPPERQLALAAALNEDPAFYEEDLAWTGPPTRAQLSAACRLIIDYLRPIKGKHNGVASAQQLATRLNRLRLNPDLAGLVTDELARDYAATADEAVESVMQFVRSWAQFEFPKQLRALERIAREILGKAGLSVGDLGTFAAQVEGLFLPPHIATLDEYGIPPQLGTRLFPLGEADLDALLDSVRSLDIQEAAADSFERELLSIAQARL